MDTYTASQMTVLLLSYIAGLLTGGLIHQYLKDILK